LGVQQLTGRAFRPALCKKWEISAVEAVDFTARYRTMQMAAFLPRSAAAGLLCAGWRSGGGRTV
jgi:hypothetical protein